MFQMRLGPSCYMLIVVNNRVQYVNIKIEEA